MAYSLVCNGCGHRTCMTMIDNIIEENELSEKTIICLDVACCSLLIDEMPYDAIMCAHGRCIPTSIGIKSIRENNLVINYMGDGAAYSIGLNELVSSAVRNDHVLNIIINNTFCAMTGGQCSPTSLENQKTITTPFGKKVEKYGKPFHIEDVIGKLNINYLARCSLTKDLDNTKKILQKAIDIYNNKKGFVLVELLSPCPTNLHMKVADSYKYVDDEIMKEYKLGEYVS